jgi:ferredoxin
MINAVAQSIQRLHDLRRCQKHRDSMIIAVAQIVQRMHYLRYCLQHRHCLICIALASTEISESAMLATVQRYGITYAITNGTAESAGYELMPTAQILHDLRYCFQERDCMICAVAHSTEIT